eukprot:TRINITY_DN19459_c0_g1_i2.p1 TRINITY_DN19459_c0_g1~~TRINITY_DN19459_c0_g1_i2.p1  ORF type:complete len:614 (+),score=114.64 TRINITY_DN19459_c0_g1_i2:127-1968(+)
MLPGIDLIRKSCIKNLLKISIQAFSTAPLKCHTKSIPISIPRRNLNFISFTCQNPGTRFRKLCSKPESDNDSEKHDDLFRLKGVSEPPRLFVVQPRMRPESVLQAKLQEAIKLADSLQDPREELLYVDGKPKKLPYIIVQNPEARLNIQADKYFGQGTVESIKGHLDVLSTQYPVDAVFVNAILTGVQQRNLERAWGTPVFDRVGLIIEIFNAHAQTKEAKLQAELAALMYMKTRLIRVRGEGGRLAFGAHGEAEVVSARGRASGGRGFISGAGETELQLQRRRILERRKHLLQEIEQVRKTRALHRAARRRHSNTYYGQNLPTVAVVGYTNAGKSSLVAALSDSNLYIDDKLFATLDPRVRKVILPSGQKALLSDTVGFISDLPVQLVEAFHATLEEVTEADLLMHVIDSSAPNMEDQRNSVLDVLEQIGVSTEKLENMIEVLNKVDLLQGNTQDKTLAAESGQTHFAEISPEISPDYCSEEIVSPETKIYEENDFKIQENTVGVEFSDGSPENVPSSEDDIYEDNCNEIVRTEKPANCNEIVTTKKHAPELRKERKWNVFGIARVETSAITGEGLQELLDLLDAKLKPTASGVTKERDIYSAKWRPPSRAV